MCSRTDDSALLRGPLANAHDRNRAGLGPEADVDDLAGRRRLACRIRSPCRLADEGVGRPDGIYHRVVPCAHDALVTDQMAAQTSRQAIRDVVHAERSAVPTNKS